MPEHSDTIEVVEHDHAPGNPFVCNVCKKSYSRIDHLARHYRFHSQERPFTCKVCDKAFARVDLLKRHGATHESALNQSDGPSFKRRRTQSKANRSRAQRACKACAEAKARCEGDSPCSRCLQKSISCTYPPRKNIDTDKIDETSTSNDGQIRQTCQGADDHFLDAELPVPCDIATASNHTNTLLSERIDQIVLPLSIASGSAFGQMSNHTGVPPTNTLSGGPRHGNFLNPDATTIHESLISLDFLPLDTSDHPAIFDDLFGASNHPADFDDLLNEKLFTNYGSGFGVEFAFNSPINVDSALVSQFPGALVSLSSTSLNDPDLTIQRNGIITPDLKSKLNITASAQAYKESFWRWTPAKDDHGSSEQRHLSFAWDGTVPGLLDGQNALSSHHKITDSARGAVLAMVLRTCEPGIYQHVVSNFPSTQLMTQLLHGFLVYQTQAEFPFIHIPTVTVANERAEFLAIMIAYGAALSLQPEVRKLGFALQEAQRTALPLAFECDNRLTRSLRPLQCLALEHEIGLWSGNRRKMEITESASMHLITMLRRAGRFRAAKVPEPVPQEQDTGDRLETKWRAWIQQESFKRLALCMFYKDARSSMSLLSPPLVSYTELTISPPCRKDLWEAETAVEWKTIYLAHFRSQPPIVCGGKAWINDSAFIFRNLLDFDQDVSPLLITCSIWPQLWQYREMIIANRSSWDGDDRHGSLVASSKRQDLIRLLELISMNAKEWHIDLKPAVWLLHEQCSMHLYVSLEEVQLLAGKEGEDECRRVFPTLKAWVKTPEARQGLFHAGQVIRAAREYKKFMLRDASAVAVYHASLVFWAYAVVSLDEHKISPEPAHLRASQYHKSDLIRLDDVEGPEMRRFLVLGRGIPCIHVQSEGANGPVTRDIPLTEPAEVMSIISSLLRKQYDGMERGCAPLIDNLSRLMLLLGKAYISHEKHQ